MSKSILLAQVTDAHLLAQTTAELRGCNVWQSFNTVLQDVVRCNPDGLILTGDLAERGEADAYGHLVAAIAPLHMPIYWLPGNHDHLENLQQALQLLPTSQGLTAVNLGHWQLMLLNSVLPQAKFGEGHLSPQQLINLQTHLKQHPHKPTLIALHHQPVPVGIDWVDQMQIRNSREFLTVLDHFPNVKLVVFGHIHHEFHGRSTNGVDFYGCPSTCLQVISPELEVVEERPGFRLVWLYGDGSYRTEVRRVKIRNLVKGGEFNQTFV
ncbi:MAG: metallophosphoesterase [Cyanobacteria bacterium P01_F01_bin.13]